MATSGKITGAAKRGSTTTTYYDFWCDWKRNDYSIANNTSNITVNLCLVCNSFADGAWNLQEKPSVSLKVGGAAKTPTITHIDTRNYVTCTFATWTGDVKHNADGSPNCAIVASFTHYGSSSLTGGSLSGSADLDTIPQATTLDALTCATSYFTGTMTYKYTPKASTLYNRCNISLNLNGTYTSVKSINLGKKSAAQQTATVTLSSDELTTIYKKLPKATKGVLRFTFYTYSDSGYSKQVGSTSVKELTLNIPNSTDTQPTVGMSLAPVGSLPAAFEGLYIKGKTKVKATLTSAPKHDATVTSYKMKVDGVSYYSSDGYTSGYLSKYGTIKVYGYATDSRGFTGSADKDIVVIDYAKPKVLDAEAVRCDASGNAADDGAYLKITAKRSYSKVVSDGTQKNFCAIRYRWKSEHGAYSDWITIHAKMASGDTVTTGALLNGALAVDTTYLVQVGVVDDVGESAHTTIAVPTDKVYWHRDGARRAFAFGEYVQEDNTFAIAGDIGFHAKGGISRISRYDYNDFDTLIYRTGYYTSNSAPSAAGCSNYPVDKTGVLEVISNMSHNATTGAWWGFAWQTYRTYGGVVYTRSYYTGDGWTPWSIKVDFNLVYPVGSIYLTTASTNPATLFGGTWERIKDTFLLAAGGSYGLGETGGEATHTLTTAELPSHRHSGNAVPVAYNPDGYNAMRSATLTQQGTQLSYTEYAGGGAAHNNMPPYLAVNVWKRTA